MLSRSHGANHVTKSKVIETQLMGPVIFRCHPVGCKCEENRFFSHVQVSKEETQQGGNKRQSRALNKSRKMNFSGQLDTTSSSIQLVTDETSPTIDKSNKFNDKNSQSHGLSENE